MEKNLNTHPLVSVLMPVYNGEAYVGEAIRSILSQTMDDFECLIINDGSTDGSENVILSFKDPRIVYVKNDGNQGLIYTLNKGIAMARGTYIARMDADDVCDPSRFAKQVKTFSDDQSLVICGSFIKKFGKEEAYVDYMPVSHGEIMAAVFVSCPFAHPSVMLKKAALPEVPYRADYKHSEDYDLWSRLVFTGHALNIPEFLLHYREHDKQVSLVYEDVKYQTVLKIQQNLLQQLDLDPDAFEHAFHLNFFKGISRQDRAYLEKGAAWLTKFHQAFIAAYPQFKQEFNRMLAMRWLKIVGNSGLGLWGLKTAFRQPFFSAKCVKFKDLMKFLYKTLSGYKQVENS